MRKSEDFSVSALGDFDELGRVESGPAKNIHEALEGGFRKPTFSRQDPTEAAGGVGDGRPFIIRGQRDDVVAGGEKRKQVHLPAGVRSTVHEPSPEAVGFPRTLEGFVVPLKRYSDPIFPEKMVGLDGLKELTLDWIIHHGKDVPVAHKSFEIDAFNGLQRWLAPKKERSDEDGSQACR